MPLTTRWAWPPRCRTESSIVLRVGDFGGRRCAAVAVGDARRGGADDRRRLLGSPPPREGVAAGRTRPRGRRTPAWAPAARRGRPGPIPTEPPPARAWWIGARILEMVSISLRWIMGNSRGAMATAREARPERRGEAVRFLQRCRSRSSRAAPRARRVELASAPTHRSASAAPGSSELLPPERPAAVLFLPSPPRAPPPPRFRSPTSRAPAVRAAAVVRTTAASLGGFRARDARLANRARDLGEVPLERRHPKAPVVRRAAVRSHCAREVQVRLRRARPGLLGERPRPPRARVLLTLLRTLRTLMMALCTLRRSLTRVTRGGRVREARVSSVGRPAARHTTRAGTRV